MKKLSALGIIVSSTLILSSCAAYPSIIELSQPPNQCDGSEIYLELDNETPTYTFESSETVSLSVVDSTGTPVSNADLQKITVEYRVGLFGENGLQETNTDGFSERSPYHPSATPSASPLPSTDAFLDILWDVGGPTATPAPRPDGETFSTVALSSSVETVTVEELVSETTAPEMQLLGAIPGAFLAKCIESGEFVAAVPMFPNTSLEDVSPVATFVETPTPAVELDFSRLFSSGMVSGEVLVNIASVRPIVFSANELSQRWLNGTSFDLEDYGTGVVESTSVSFDAGFSLPDDALAEIGTLNNGTYYAILTYILQTDDLESDGPDILRFGSAHYDVVVSNGNYNFILRYFEPVRSPSITPQVSGLGDKVSVSTKGFRELTVSGSRLGKIQSATIGGRKAKILSSYGSELKLRLPALAAGSYELNLKYSGGEIKNARSVTYLPSKRISQLELASSRTKAAWVKRANALLDKNPAILQVDCVVTVASGTSAKALRSKASSICKSLAKENPEVRAVTRTVIGQNAKTGFVLKFWG